MSHTPGPWTVEDRRKSALKNIRVVSGQEEIAWMSHTHQRDDQGGFKGNREGHAAADAIDAIGLANACLIAAAPDLLAACKLAKERLDQVGMEWLGKGPDPLEAAIAKAEGRS